MVWNKNKGNFDKYITKARANMEWAIDVLEASPSSLPLQAPVVEKREKLRDIFVKEEVT